MSAWTVRLAGPGDEETVSALEAQSFDRPVSSGGRSDNAHERVLLAGEGEGAPQGFAVWRDLGEDAELLSLGVLPTARRKGAGRALLREVFRAARAGGAGRLILEVSAQNEAALALYRGAGFEPLSVRKRYYGDGSDAVVMHVAL